MNLVVLFCFILFSLNTKYSICLHGFWGEFLYQCSSIWKVGFSFWGVFLFVGFVLSFFPSEFFQDVFFNFDCNLKIRCLDVVVSLFGWFLHLISPLPLISELAGSVVCVWLQFEELLSHTDSNMLSVPFLLF